MRKTLICLALMWSACAGASPLTDAIERDMQRLYVFPEVAGKAVKSLQMQERKGAYAKLTGQQLAEALTSQLRADTGDLHLHVNYSADVLPPIRDEPPTPAEIAEWKSRMQTHVQRVNYGIQKVEQLDGNIGYLDLRGFTPAPLAGDSIAAAMKLVQHTRALIIDLRQNHGGDPATVALLASYFFEERTRLNDIYWRQGNRTEQAWTVAHVAGPRYAADKPVYILTARGTFSAAEDFTYAMKNLKRAIIVGETTGGGAHPGDTVRLDDHFDMFIPGGRSISTITGTDWEGSGVAPDVAVPQEEALAAALKALQPKEKS
jgi:hypothetical protein